MLDSVDGLSTKLSDYASEEGAPLLQPAQHANRVWTEVEKGASRALENQYTQKVLTPVVNYIGELEGLKKLYEARHKKQMDFDYYRRKVQEMQVTIRRAILAQFRRALRHAIPTDAGSRPPTAGEAAARRVEAASQRGEAQRERGGVHHHVERAARALRGDALREVGLHRRAVHPDARLPAVLLWQPGDGDGTARAVLERGAAARRRGAVHGARNAKDRIPGRAGDGGAGGAAAGDERAAADGAGRRAAAGRGRRRAAAVCAAAAGRRPGRGRREAAAAGDADAGGPMAPRARPPPVPGMGGGPPPVPGGRGRRRCGDPRPPPVPGAGGPMAPPGPRRRRAAAAAVPAAAPRRAPAGGQQLRALTAYEPADPRMIPMNAGEIMIKEKEEGGWFFGSNSRGQQGFFPGSYCEPV